MILPETFTADWINNKRRIYKRGDPIIMEKVIHALALVEFLSLSGLDFVFKGGTSLLLIMPEPKRFSIDVDIVTTESPEKIETILKELCDGKVFQSFYFEEGRSYKNGVPKAHYRINYTSKISGQEQYILLDILNEKHGYHEITDVPIKNEWLQTEGENTKVKIPTVNSIIGDKLTAFAPNTIGIPYDKGKEMEIMKQLFDVGMLFEHLSILTPFKNSFEAIAIQEMSYRKIEGLSRETVLNDIIETSLTIASRGHKLGNKENRFSDIEKGLSRIGPYIYTGAFRLDEAILASSKAAYLASVLLSGYEGEIHRWQDGDDIIKYKLIPIQYQFLNKLIKLPGAGAHLYYWYQALKLDISQ